MADEKMVKFLMPDGTEVSNDPRFGLEEALQKQLEATPNRGDVGITHEEQVAQTQTERLAPGEDGPIEDPTRSLHGPQGSPAQQRQVEDRKQAQELGGTPKSTAVEDDEPVDSNERVAEVRRKMAERYAKAQEALESSGEEAGNPEEPYSEWSGKQLKAEVARRNADGRDEEQMLKISKGMKIADVATMLEEDDRNSAASTTGEGPTGDPVTQEDMGSSDSDEE